MSHTIILTVALIAGGIAIFELSRYKEEESPKVQIEPPQIGEVCTLWTKTYPRHEATVWAVGEGENQKLRMDHFIMGATGRQAEYIIVNSGITYRWNTWNKKPKEGVRFPNTPVPFREYFGLQNQDLSCNDWKPSEVKFEVPKDINFIAVTENYTKR